MTIMPEKVEGKLFLITLIICLGASLFFSQLILLTEEDRLLQETQYELVSHSEQHNLNLILGMSARTELAQNLVKNLRGELRTRALAEEFVVSDLRQSDTGMRFGIWESSNAGFILKNDQELTPDVTERLTHAATVMTELAPGVLAKFVEIDIELDSGIHILAPISHVLSRANEPLAQTRDIGITLDSDEPAAEWGDLVFDPERNVWLSSLSVPIRNDGEVIGHLKADALVDDVINDVHAYTVTGTSGYGYLINQAGEVLVHQQLSPTLVSRSRSGRGALPPNESGDAIVETIHSALHGEETFLPKQTRELTLEMGEQTLLAYYDPIGFKDWAFISYTNTESIETYIASLRWKTLLSAALLAVCLMILLRDSFRRFFLGRVLNLEKATREYAEKKKIRNPRSRQSRNRSTRDFIRGSRPLSRRRQSADR